MNLEGVIPSTQNVGLYIVVLFILIKHFHENKLDVWIHLKPRKWHLFSFKRGCPWELNPKLFEDHSANA